MRSMTGVAAIAILTGLPVMLAAIPAQAVVCTGTTTMVSNGENVSAPFLLTPGNCVAAGDKIFGEFSTSGAITNTGTASFTFLMTPGNVTVGFSGVVGPSATGSINYTAAIDPGLAQGFLITDLEKDFTLNAGLTGLPASATLAGTTNPETTDFFCTRTVNPATSTCPQSAAFDGITQLTVNETISTGPNAIVTAITDTISQSPPAPINEPSSLALIGGTLLITGWLTRRRRS